MSGKLRLCHTFKVEIMSKPRIKIARNLDWNLLKVFYEIAEAKGVTSAANLLWRKQSTISLSLKRLEVELGTRLCSRGPGGFVLSDEGQLLLESCKKIYDSIDEIPNKLSNISDEIRGQLKFITISNFSNCKLDDVITTYNSRCPHVEIDIDVATWESIPPSILRNESDIGIAPINVQYSDLQYDFLCQEHHHVYCGARHHLFSKTIDNLDELKHEALILTGNDEPEQLTKFRMKHGIGDHVAAVTTHLEEAKRLTSLGIGICILPETLLQKELDERTIWPLTPRIDELSINIYVITHARSQRNLAFKCFLEEFAKLNIATKTSL